MTQLKMLLLACQSHTEFWSSSMHRNFHIVHLKEKTSKFCIFTNRFKMAAMWCFIRYIFNLFLKLIYFALETKFNSIKLNLLRYNSYCVNYVVFINSSICSIFFWLAEIQVLYQMDHTVIWIRRMLNTLITLVKEFTWIAVIT